MEKAMRVWHTKGNRGKAYTQKTQKTHTVYMVQWAAITGLTPNQLAQADIPKIRRAIADYYRGKIRIETFIHRNAALNAFWRANGRKIAKSDEYDGIDKNTHDNVFKFRHSVSKPKKTQKSKNDEHKVSKD